MSVRVFGNRNLTSDKVAAIISGFRVNNEMFWRIWDATFSYGACLPAFYDYGKAWRSIVLEEAKARFNDKDFLERCIKFIWAVGAGNQMSLDRVRRMILVLILSDIQTSKLSHETLDKLVDTVHHPRK